jgi:hypothetical protein
MEMGEGGHPQVQKRIRSRTIAKGSMLQVLGGEAGSFVVHRATATQPPTPQYHSPYYGLSPISPFAATRLHNKGWSALTHPLPTIPPSPPPPLHRPPAQ